MNARTERAIALAAAGFRLIRTKGTVISQNETIISWMQGTAGLSGRLYTSGLRVHLEIWTHERVLAVNRITGAADCEVEECNRGLWD